MAPVMKLRGGRSAFFKPKKESFFGSVTSFTVRGLRQMPTIPHELSE
jgi:hypothetical protein